LTRANLYHCSQRHCRMRSSVLRNSKQR